MTGSSTTPEARPVALVADDAHDSRTLLANMLRHAGLRVVEARDGAQAQTLFQEARPVLTFLDIDMPGTDGFAALEAIRALDPKATVVIVSATSSLANVQQTMQLGALGFVVKPYSAKRIIEILRQAAASTGDRRLMPD
jgi:two-component system chemotaxis response regulator CheY